VFLGQAPATGYCGYEGYAAFRRKCRVVTLWYSVVTEGTNHIWREYNALRQVKITVEGE